MASIRRHQGRLPERPYNAPTVRSQNNNRRGLARYLTDRSRPNVNNRSNVPRLFDERIWTKPFVVNRPNTATLFDRGRVNGEKKQSRRFTNPTV